MSSNHDIVRPNLPLADGEPSASSTTETRHTVNLPRAADPPVNATQHGKTISITPKIKPSDVNIPIMDVPHHINDYFEKLNIVNNIEFNSGPHNCPIDHQLDYRYVFLFLVYNVVKIFNDIDLKQSPLVTPSSMMAYFLSLVYGHALLTETSDVRPDKSKYASEFMSNTDREDLEKFLSTAPVPDFLLPLFRAISAVQDPKRIGIYVTHNLACYYFKQDFGRAYPIQSFFIGHHLIASNPSNANPQEILDKFYNSSLLEHDNNVLIRNRNIFGANTSNGNFHSAIIRGIESMFNPVTSRSLTNRPIFSRMPTFPQTTTAALNINPYIYLLNADTDNVTNTLINLKNLANVTSTYVETSCTLGSILSTGPSLQIYIHHYQQMDFPTWYKSTDEGKNDEITAAQYAQTVGFMASKYPESALQNIPYPTIPEGTGFIAGLYMQQPTAQPYNPANDPDKIRPFETSRDVTPNILLFNPWEEAPASYGYNYIKGSHIETDHVSSFAVPQPNASDPLIVTNSQFLNSAVPLCDIVNAYDVDRQHPFISYYPVRPDNTEQSVRASFGDMSINRLPLYPTTIYDAYTTASYFEGFHSVNDIGDYSRASNVYATHIATAENPSKEKRARKPFYAWSSFRYYNTNVSSATPFERRTYMILNNRTHFGTNVTAARGPHGFKLMPTA